MSILNLELDFNRDHGGTSPYSPFPFARISIKGLGRKDGENLGYLTCHCATIGELNSELDRLNQQLEEIRSRANKMFFAEYKKLLGCGP